MTAWLLSKRFGSFSCAYFRSYILRFLSTVGFSNEDNCCQLQGIGKLIKEKLSKGIIKVDELTNVAGNTDFVKFIANIYEQTTIFFHKSSAFWSYFFLKSCLKVLGAAYTRVFTVVCSNLSPLQLQICKLEKSHGCHKLLCENCTT